MILMSSCGGDDGGDDQGDGQTCRKAPGALVAAIEEGLTASGGGQLRRAYIVRSDDFEKVYMVAADIQGDGLEGDGDIGVWARIPPKPKA
jgi:hypothetical protein